MCVCVENLAPFLYKYLLCKNKIESMEIYSEQQQQQSHKDTDTNTTHTDRDTYTEADTATDGDTYCWQMENSMPFHSISFRSIPRQL